VSVIAPFTVFAVEPVVAKAPALLTPVPIKDKVLPLGSVTPLNNNSPPELTTTPFVPSALLLLTLMIPPALMVVVPV